MWWWKRIGQGVIGLFLVGAVVSSVGPSSLPSGESVAVRRYLGRFLAWPFEAVVERPYALDPRNIDDEARRRRLAALEAEARAGLVRIDPDPDRPGRYPAVTVLRLTGEPWEMGWVYGRVLGDEVRANVRENMMPVIRMLAWPRQLDQAWSNVAPFIPQEYTAELAGMAQSSGVKLRLLQQMHAVPEISESMCSGYAFDDRITEDGASYHIRILDYATYLNVQRNPVVVFYRPLDAAGNPQGYAYVNVAWAGFDWSVGGVNELGLALGEIGGGRADALEGERPDGEPMGVLVRRVLNQAANVPEAENLIATARRNLRYVYVMSDRREQQIILSGPNLYRVNRAGETLEKLGERYSELIGFDGIAWHGANTDTHAARFTEKSTGLGLADVFEHNKAVALEKNLHAWVLRRDGCDDRGCETLELWVANALGTYERAVDQPYVRIDLNEHFARLRD